MSECKMESIRKGSHRIETKWIKADISLIDGKETKWRVSNIRPVEALIDQHSEIEWMRCDLSGVKDV